jgi:glycogen(starch) synthase
LALRARGHDVRVVTSHGHLDLPDRADHEGVEIRRYPFLEALRSTRLDLLAAARTAVNQFKREFRPEVVHLFFTGPGILFHWMTQVKHPARTVTGVPIGLDGLQGGDRTLLTRTLTRSDWVIANSRAMRSDVLEIAPELKDRCTVIYNSLDSPGDTVCPIPFDPPVLLCLGRVAREKGFDLAIEALPEILRRFPRTQLWIAGDGPARAGLQEQVAALGLANSVVFTGWIDPPNVPQLLNQATVVLMPSRWREAFGNVALQAMQAQRPVVAAEVGGLPEVVSSEDSGLLVPPEDPPALAAAVLRLLNDPKLAHRMGQTGKSTALTRFGFREYVDQHEGLYARLSEL